MVGMYLPFVEMKWNFESSKSHSSTKCLNYPIHESRPICDDIRDSTN